MKILIRCIPRSVTLVTLSRFINHGLFYPWYYPFKLKGKVREHEIIRITNRDTGAVEFHAVVDIQPARTAVYLIQKLNGRELDGRAVDVRKWYARSPMRDRRRHETPEHAEAFNNRRGSDRRRGSKLMIEIVSSPMEGAVIRRIEPFELD